MIDKWKGILGLLDWSIITESIDANSVTYDKDCPKKDRYFVGVEADHDSKTAIIYHDRDLIEEDITHELLHVKYPDWTEDQVNKATRLLLKIN